MLNIERDLGVVNIGILKAVNDVFLWTIES